MIASGGAGAPQHLADVLKEAKADAVLIASITHYGEYTIRQLKDHLKAQGVKAPGDLVLTGRGLFPPPTPRWAIERFGRDAPGRDDRTCGKN